MPKFYFTFGQDHAHIVDNFTWDKDVVCEIEAPSYGEARAIMVDAFGQKWAFQYEELPDMRYFPRGVRSLYA